MNIHLPAILMFTRGTRFWHTAILWPICDRSLKIVTIACNNRPAASSAGRRMALLSGAWARAFRHPLSQHKDTLDLGHSWMSRLWNTLPCSKRVLHKANQFRPHQHVELYIIYCNTLLLFHCRGTQNILRHSKTASVPFKHHGFAHSLQAQRNHAWEIVPRRVVLDIWWYIMIYSIILFAHICSL
jgi:hypothetical protein